MAAAYAKQAKQLLPTDQGNSDFGILIIEACDLLLSGDVYSGRLEAVLQASDNYDPDSSEIPDFWYLELRAMIDIAAGRAGEALARYEVYWKYFCYDDSGDDLWVCLSPVLRVMQLAGDQKRAQRFVEERLKYIKPWFDRYPTYWTPLYYAESLTLLGRTDEALDVLEAHVASGWRGQLFTWFTLEYDITFELIRDHPRFQALITTVREDFAQQLETVRALERKGELPSLQEVQKGPIFNFD